MKSAAALAEQQAAEEAEYQRMKAELQTWCQGTALACFLATLIFYSKVRVLFAKHEDAGAACLFHMLLAMFSTEVIKVQYVHTFLHLSTFMHLMHQDSWCQHASCSIRL